MAHRRQRRRAEIAPTMPFQEKWRLALTLLRQVRAAEYYLIDLPASASLNTLVGLAILHTAIQLPFSLYIMRNSFEAVPRELEEAAVMDGGSAWQVLIKVFIPAGVPAIVTVTLFAFITSWNEFLGALVLLSRASTFTLPLILATARAETSLGGTDWGMLQAGITIAMIPCIGIYLLLQKYYVSGFTSGAVK